VSRFAPYGFRLVARCRLVANPKEQALLGQLGTLRRRGLSLRAISRAMAGRGALAWNGRPLAPSTLFGLVRNRTVMNTKGVS
jgi:hypothetical protein